MSKPFQEFKSLDLPRLEQEILDHWDDENTFDELAEGNYTVIVQDGNGCFVSDTIRIQSRPRLNPNIIISPPTCRENSDGALGINFVEGGGNY